VIALSHLFRDEDVVPALRFITETATWHTQGTTALVPTGDGVVLALVPDTWTRSDGLDGCGGAEVSSEDAVALAVAILYHGLVAARPGHSQHVRESITSAMQTLSDNLSDIPPNEERT
jgi:hypothetical protein